MTARSCRSLGLGLRAAGECLYVAKRVGALLHLSTSIIIDWHVRNAGMQQNLNIANKR